MDLGHRRNHRRFLARQRPHLRLGAGGKKARLMDANAADPSPARVTVEAGLDAFLASKQGQRLSHSWLYKFSVTQRELVSFAHGRGLTDELGLLQSILEGRAHHRPETAGTLALVFFYCVRKRWLKQDPVEELGPIKLRPVPRLERIRSILILSQRGTDGEVA